MSDSDYPFADTAAARMLDAGLQKTSRRTGQSLRQLAPSLGYKTSVALSHMAMGRVPIPVDRSSELAERLEIDPTAFLAAVLVQRHPNIDFSILTGTGGSATESVKELYGGRHPDELNLGQRRVLREAIADVQASRRWLSPHEVLVVEMLRDRRPTMVTDGLSRADTDAIIKALSSPRV